MFYGRDYDVEEILKLLLEKETDKEEGLSVVTIVGLGGLGKTTLAQLVYNHERVVKQESFDSRIWVCVSDPFDIKMIAKAIIESVTGKKCDLSGLDPIANRVHQILENKKFLLVLDDVWNENEEKWERLKEILAVGAKGSRIMVTTCSVQVASIMGGTIPPYRLGVLSEDACWRLFEQRAFWADDVQREPSLEAIGREIVAKCGGSPLAAKALGSLMRFKTGKQEWEAVRDSDIWIDEGNQVMASLRLRYDHLSPELKQCFTYCSIFPKGTSINRDVLVLHWIALGFIPYNTSLEYFNHLVWISFLHEDSSRLYKPGQEVYKIHVPVHDLAKSVAGDEQFICYADQKATIPPRCRYCTLVGTLEESELKELFRESRKVRALRLQDSNITSSTLFTSLPRLRVLDRGRSLIKEVHASIDRLLHLRYFRHIGNLMSLPQSFTSLQNLQTLDLSHCNSLRSLPESLDSLQSLQILNLTYCITLVSLPESIGKLANLRTLQLSNCEAMPSLPQSLSNLSNLEELALEGCKNIVELPEGMGNMTSLRHLKNKGMSSLRGMPFGSGKMRSLVTLQLFVVGEGTNHNSIAEMQHLNLIEGELKLKHLENEKSPGDAARANIKEKHSLQRLCLRWSTLITHGSCSIHEEVLAGLTPHPNLKELEIMRYPGINFLLGVPLPCQVDNNRLPEDARRAMHPHINEGAASSW